MSEVKEKKYGPSDFQAEVERLHAAGLLPQLRDLLGAVAETRKEYAPKILEARKQGGDNVTE